MVFSILKDRAILTVSGEGAQSFLQALITQNVAPLAVEEAAFALLLNNKGRFIADFFVINSPLLPSHSSIAAGSSVNKVPTYNLEMASDDVEVVLSYFKKYKLRSKVQFSTYPATVVVLFLPTLNGGVTNKASSREALNLADQAGAKHVGVSKVVKLEHTFDSLGTLQNMYCYQDPRTQNLGLRVFIGRQLAEENNLSIEKLLQKLLPTSIEANVGESSTQLAQVDQDEYAKVRYSLGVAESEDLIKDKSIPLELGFDHLNAISFNKGCYLGQEFTNSCKRVLEVRKAPQAFKLLRARTVGANNEDSHISLEEMAGKELLSKGTILTTQDGATFGMILNFSSPILFVLAYKAMIEIYSQQEELTLQLKRYNTESSSFKLNLTLEALS